MNCKHTWDKALRMDQVKAVFHKIYLIYSWILCYTYLYGRSQELILIYIQVEPWFNTWRKYVCTPKDNINLPILWNSFCVLFPVLLPFLGVTEKLQLSSCGIPWTLYSDDVTLSLLLLKLSSLHIKLVSYEVAFADGCHVMFVVNERLDWMTSMLSIATSEGATWKTHNFYFRRSQALS